MNCCTRFTFKITVTNNESSSVIEMGTEIYSDMKMRTYRERYSYMKTNSISNMSAKVYMMGLNNRALT